MRTFKQFLEAADPRVTAMYNMIQNMKPETTMSVAGLFQTPEEFENAMYYIFSRNSDLEYYMHIDPIHMTIYKGDPNDV